MTTYRSIEEIDNASCWYAAMEEDATILLERSEPAPDDTTGHMIMSALEDIVSDCRGMISELSDARATLRRDRKWYAQEVAADLRGP